MSTDLNKPNFFRSPSDFKRMLPVRIFLILGLIGSMWRATQYFAETFAFHPALGWNYQHVYLPWSIVQWWTKYHVLYADDVAAAMMHGISWAVAVLAVCMMAAFWIWTRPTATEGLHGTARWAEFSDMREAGLLPRLELGAFEVIWREITPPVRMAIVTCASAVLEVAIGLFLPRAGMPVWVTAPLLLAVPAVTFLCYRREEMRLADGKEIGGVVVGGVEMKRWRIVRKAILGFSFLWPVSRVELVPLMHNGKEHVLTFAPTRSGKGVGLILPSLYEWRESVVCTDIKGELWELTSGYRSEVLGNVCMRFEPSCPSVTYPDGTRSTARWNPLDEVRIRPYFTREVIGNSCREPGGDWVDDAGTLEVKRDDQGFISWNDDKGVGDAQNLAMLMVDPLGKGLEDHWAKTAHALTVGLILHAIYMYQSGLSDKRPSPPLIDAILSDSSRPLKDLWADMILGGSNPAKGIRGYYRNDAGIVDPREKQEAEERRKALAAGKKVTTPEKTMAVHKGSGHPSVMSAAQDMVDRPENEAGSVISTAKSNLALYRDPVVAENTSYSDFSILDLMYHEKPVSLYLVLPPSDKDRMMPLVRILLNACMRNLVEVRPQLRLTDADALPPGRKVKHRLLGMLDEFPSVGKLPIIQEGLAYVAGYGIKLYLITQDLAQIHDKYGKDESITSNCHVQNAYNPLRMETAKYISERCGQSTVIHEKRSASGNFGTGSGRSTSDSVNEVQRPLITPDEVMTLQGPLKNSKGHIEKPGKMLVMVAGVPVIMGTQSLFFKFPKWKAANDMPAIRLKPIDGITVPSSLWQDDKGNFWKASQVVIKGVKSDTERRLGGVVANAEKPAIDAGKVRAVARVKSMGEPDNELDDDAVESDPRGAALRESAEEAQRAYSSRRQNLPASGRASGSGDDFVPSGESARRSGETAGSEGSGRESSSGEPIGALSGKPAPDAPHGANDADAVDESSGGGGRPEKVRRIAIRVATSGSVADADDRVVEIAAVEIVGGELTGKVFYRQVEPPVPIEAVATERHGLTDGQVEGAPAFSEVAAELSAFMQDAELVFWDWQREMGALEGEYDLIEMKRPEGDAAPALHPPGEHELVDVREMARGMHPNGPSDLAGLYEVHGIESTAAEGSRADTVAEAKALASLFLAMQEARGAQERDQEAEDSREDERQTAAV
jgi:type IV secretion system protein VirD4